MMKRIAVIIIALALLLSWSCVNAGLIHRAGVQNLANSQFNPSDVGGIESALINRLKSSSDWVCNASGAHALPSDLDTNGYPLSTAPCVGTGGFKIPDVGVSSQFERPGNWVIVAAGRGATFAFDNNSATSASPGASGCTGARSGGGNITCTNSSCTGFTGQISGQTLTITVASSCTMVLFQPISNGSTVVNISGVPTMIIGMSGSANCPSCTGAGGTGTYFVNWSQNIALSSFIAGMYNEITQTAGTEKTTSIAIWTVAISATDATNPIGYMGFLHKNDLLAYAQGQLTGPLFKQRVKQANWAINRNLGWQLTNVSNETTWATRKPTTYFSYGASEKRQSIYACSYGFYNGTTPCTTNYALNGSSNDYAVNIGGSPVDKQTLCVQWSTNATNGTATFSIDNGVTKAPILNYHAGTLAAGGTDIVANSGNGLVYDAALASWLSTIGGQSNSCLINKMPPEINVLINQELGTTPWIVQPLYASDPITDYMTQYALLIQSYSWNKAPIFEIPDEPWNCAGQGVGPYISAKTRAYAVLDPAWANGSFFCGAGGDIANWTGKAGSLLGQAIRSISQTYVVLVGVQTVQNGTAQFNNSLRSNSYVTQNPSNIPAQSGCAGPGAIQTSCPTPFTQTAAYQAMKGSTSAASGITIANYWNLADQQSGGGALANQQAEVPLAYCYFFQSGGCASQSSIMTTYMASQGITQVVGSIPAITTLWSNWFNFAQSCAGGSSCTPLSMYNYEGGYSPATRSSDRTVPVTSAINANSAVLTANPNGALAGMTVTITAAAGGTWSTLVGNSYVVSSATSSAITIPADSTGLGTLSSMTLTYTGSTNYINYLRLYSWLSPDLGSYNTLLYNQISGASGACGVTPCSFFPSQFLLAGTSVGNCCWLAWSPDIWGYFQVASSSGATATGGSLTLGGTVTGIFTPGLAVVGGGFPCQSVASDGNCLAGVTITGVCTQTGALPAGANSGDVCPISSSSTIASSSIIGAATPPANSAGNSTTSPVKAWGSICKWNGNTNQCDGTWLLKRDIDPASNDNDPMWLEKAA